MTLRTQILLGYGGVLALAAGVVALAVGSIVRLGDAQAAVLSENYRSIEAAETMADALERQDSAVLLGAAGAGQFRSNAPRFSDALATAQGNVTVVGEGAAAADIERAYAAFASAAAGGADYETAVRPRFEAAKAAVARLRDLNEAAMVAASDRAAAEARRAVARVVGVAAGVLLLGVALSVALAARVSRPVRRMRAAARRIAAGDLDVAVAPGASDELGALAAAFNEMTARLRAYRALDVERLVAEQRKGAAVIATVTDGILLLRADDTVDGLNPAAEAALGADRGAALGQPLAAVSRVLAAARRAPGASPRFIDSPDGARHFEVVETPVELPGEGAPGALVVLRDVTGLRELDRLKSAFVATASHELKTPLTSMSMGVAFLKDRLAGRVSGVEADILGAVSEDVERLTDLVRDLLDLSKIDAGGLSLSLAPTPVADLVAQAVRGVGLPAHTAGVEVTADVPDTLVVRADAPRVQHVLTNLLANALRFTDRGGHVAVSARPAGALVEITVADDGDGIPLDLQGRIFDRFVQAPGAKAAGGSGLGLAICREIVEAHGGTIWVESAPGHGATFTFTLPAAA